MLVVFVIALAGFKLLRVGDWGGDHIAPAGPFPKIDQAAAFGTERELRLAAQDDLATSGTTQAADLLPGHELILAN